jgi:hypothetical protein
MRRALHSLAALVAVAALAACGDFDIRDLDLNDRDGDDGDDSDDDLPDDVRRVTLSCNFEFEDGLDFATGEVLRLPFFDGSDAPVDVRCTKSRLISLRATAGTADCYADGLYAPDGPRFASIADVDGDCALASVNCNYLTSNYEPVCRGLGGVMSDRDGAQHYALRVVSDDVVDDAGVFVIEYARVP